ncbi:reverse transcriptase domain-containing protein [Tanacetum coccineum]
MYVAAVEEAVSAVLMTEINGKQVPIYFVSRALQGPEINYAPMEELMLALEGFRNGALKDNPPAEHMEEDEKPSEPCILFTDGFKATNNEAEYEALIVGLNIAEQMGV